MKLETMLWGPPHKRKNRTHHKKPLAIWKEKMARIRHKSQFRHWRIKQVTKQVYDELRAAFKGGAVETFMGFTFVKTDVLTKSDPSEWRRKADDSEGLTLAKLVRAKELLGGD